MRQADVTDDVPLHVLAGNVVPLSKGHHMTTVDVQNSSLVLVVAVPKDNVVAPAVRLCAHLYSQASCLRHYLQCNHMLALLLGAASISCKGEHNGGTRWECAGSLSVHTVARSRVECAEVGSERGKENST